MRTKTISMLGGHNLTCLTFRHKFKSYPKLFLLPVERNWHQKESHLVYAKVNALPSGYYYAWT